MRCGPWRVLGELGRGGTGVVYHARDDQGRLAALKLALEPSLAPVLRREGALLSRLTHPGIVSVLDAGETEGLPWLALELLRGQPLRALLPRGAEGTLWDLPSTKASLPPGAWGESWESAGLSPEAAFASLGPLARTLAWLHSEGVVHRDLKPENVFLTASGRVVLLDLGLGQAGREALGAPTGGSRGYLAPELRTGGRGDARSDVWAWGAMLHEALTGRLPPVGQLDPEEVGLPPALFSLLSAALQPRPADRRLPMAGVVAALERLGLLPPDPAAPRVHPPLLRPDLVEREEALEAVRALLTDPSARGELWFVGPPGSGRTRLVLEAGDAARRKGWRVVRLPGTASTARDPAGSLRELGSRGVEDALQAAQELAKARPVLILVDDLEAGGALLREVVAGLGRAARAKTSRLAVVVGAREAPGAWSRPPSLRLEPLSRPSAFLEGLLGGAPPAGLAETLPPWPAALAEGVRAALAGGALTWHGSTWSFDPQRPSLPATARVSGPARRFAGAVRLARGALSDPALEALAAPQPEQRAAAVREALREGLVEWGAVGWEPGTAPMDAWQKEEEESLYCSLGAALVAEGHLPEGAAWLAQGGDREGARRAYQQARLRGRPGDELYSRQELELTPSPAPPDLVEAATLAAEVQGDYAAVLALAPADPQGAQRTRVVRALRWVGRLDEAERSARAGLSDPEHGLSLATELAWVLARRGDSAAATEVLQTARRTREGALTGDELFRLQRTWADVQLVAGRLEGVVEAYREALRLAPNALAQASTWGNLAVALAHRGEVEEAVEATLANWSLAGQLGAANSRAIAQRNLAELVVQRGEATLGAALAAGAVLRLLPLGAWPQVLSSAVIVARRPGGREDLLQAIAERGQDLGAWRAGALASFELALRALRRSDVEGAQRRAALTHAPAEAWKQDPTLRTLAAIRDLSDGVDWSQLPDPAERARLALALAEPFPAWRAVLAEAAGAAWAQSRSVEAAQAWARLGGKPPPGAPLELPAEVLDQGADPEAVEQILAKELGLPG